MNDIFSENRARHLPLIGTLLAFVLIIMVVLLMVCPAMAEGGLVTFNPDGLGREAAGVSLGSAGEPGNLSGSSVNNLTVSKTVVGTSETGLTFQFTAEITVPDKNIDLNSLTGWPSGITAQRVQGSDTKWTVSFTITAGGEPVVLPLPTGSTYAVKEALNSRAGYTVTVNNGEYNWRTGFTGTISVDTDSVVNFTSTADVVNLTVEKAVTGISEDRDFYFTVVANKNGDSLPKVLNPKLLDGAADIPESCEYRAERVTTEYIDGYLITFKVSVKNGTGSVTIPLSKECLYQVYEGLVGPQADQDFPPAGYVITDRSNCGSGTLSSDTTAKITNAADVKTLTVNKTVSGTSASGPFGFKVEVNNAALNPANLAGMPEGCTVIPGEETGQYTIEFNLTTAVTTAGNTGSIEIPLPAGRISNDNPPVTYTVTETSHEGYGVTSSLTTVIDEQQVTFTGTDKIENMTLSADATADFTNTADVKTLTVNKTVSGTSQNGTFSFTVEVSKAALNPANLAGMPEGCTVIPGEKTGEYTIKFDLTTAVTTAGNTGSITIPLPAGCHYRVREDIPKIYSADYVNAEGDLNENKTVGITNIPYVNELTVKKVSETGMTGKSDFTVAVDYADLNPANLTGRPTGCTYSFNETSIGSNQYEGTIEFKLDTSAPETSAITIPLPKGCIYTITEETPPPSGYIVTSTLTAGEKETFFDETIETQFLLTDATAAFTNTLDVKNLTISKAVTGITGETGSFGFNLNVTGTEIDLSKIAGMPAVESITKQDINGGTWLIIFKLAHGQSIEFPLPSGCKYTITERPLTKYKIESIKLNNAFVSEISSISLEKDTEAVFTNTPMKRYLEVSKVVAGTTERGTFSFTVTVTGSDLDPTNFIGIPEGVTYTFVKPEGSDKYNGMVTFEIDTSVPDPDHPERSSIKIPLVEWCTFSVAETTPAGYTVTTGDQIRGNMTSDKYAKFTNTVETGLLKVSKAVEGYNDPAKKFPFELTLTTGTEDEILLDLLQINGMPKGVTLKAGTNNVLCFNLAAGKELSIPVPLGLSGTLKETGHAGYTVKVNGENYVDDNGFTFEGMTKNGATAAFTNTLDPENVTIKKTGYLPQTGQTWWPVPVLLLAGAAFVLTGYFRKKGKKSESR